LQAQALHLHLSLYGTPWVQRALQADCLGPTAQEQTLDLQGPLWAAYDLDGGAVLPDQVLVLQAQRLQGQALTLSQDHLARQS